MQRAVGRAHSNLVSYTRYGVSKNVSILSHNVSTGSKAHLNSSSHPCSPPYSTGMRHRQSTKKKPANDVHDKLVPESQSGLSQCSHEVSGSESVVCCSNPEIVVLQPRWSQPVCACFLLLALALPSIGIVAIVAWEWHDRPSQRGWLILGFAFYIFTALQAVWAMFMRVCEQLWHLRIQVRSVVSKTLFEAVSQAIAQASDRQSSTCSRDQEAVLEADKLTGDLKVVYRLWGSQRSSFRVRVRVSPAGTNHTEGTLLMEVRYSPGNEVVCGRDSRVQRAEVLELSIRTSSETILHDKELLKSWLSSTYKSYSEPSPGYVSVYALHESSVDWMPEWKFERAKHCKISSGTGQSFYFRRSCLNKVLVDAMFWSTTELRVYLVSGPPGVGKSEFTIWLAGQLGLPVYRLCLSSSRLTDERLAQMLSPSAITFNSVLLQVDEFQSVLSRWTEKDSNHSHGNCSSGVTAAGFAECLQGSSAMARGVVVLTGTSEITRQLTNTNLPAFFRRLHCCAELTWMSDNDKRVYFKHFLASFVTDSTEEDWTSWGNSFLSKGSPWASHPQITVDMLKQYLMQALTATICTDNSQVCPRDVYGAGEGLQLTGSCRSRFFDTVFDHNRANTFLEAYTPTNQRSETL